MKILNPNYQTENIRGTSAWSLTICILLAATATVFPGDAFATIATGSANDNNISRALCNIIVLLQGNIARGIAAGGVIFLGFSLFLGKISWGTALALGLGLGAIFGAQQIVNLASGGTSLSCTAATAVS